jgi:hypothetical protein
MATAGIVALTIFFVSYCCVFVGICTCLSWYFRQKVDNVASLGNDGKVKAKTKASSMESLQNLNVRKRL